MKEEQGIQCSNCRHWDRMNATITRLRAENDAYRTVYGEPPTDRILCGADLMRAAYPVTRGDAEIERLRALEEVARTEYNNATRILNQVSTLLSVEDYSQIVPGVERLRALLEHAHTCVRDAGCEVCAEVKAALAAGRGE